MKVRTLILLMLITLLSTRVTAQQVGRKMLVNEGGKVVASYILPEKIDSLTFKIVKFYTVKVSSTEGGVVIPTSNLVVEQDSLITFTAIPEDGYEFINWKVNGEEISTENPYTTAITSDIEIKANFNYANGATGLENGHGYVDLGLPSGLKWATCNVGAESPEEKGDYFAWGETSPKEYFDYTTYSYRYETPSVLPLSADAAHINWGGTWRMPTLDEQRELANNCYLERISGIGYKVTSKINGNYIIFPSTGLRTLSTYTEQSAGICWSNSIYPYNGDSACYLVLQSNEMRTGSTVRYYGLPIRAVCP